MSIRQIITGCRACHGGCSALVTMDGDRVIKIEPDPNGPLNKGRMCPKGLAGVELLYDPNRLTYPMKRAGERGEGKWQRITWDEAYDILEEKLGGIIEKYGVQAIGVVQGTGRHHFQNVARFANAMGTPNWFEPGTAQCYKPRLDAAGTTYGHPLIIDYYGEKKPGCILVWGSNPVVSGADGELQFHIRDCMKLGTKIVVVDPRRTELAEKADVWVQLRPGTDAAVALGMINIIIEEELYDKEFVEKWTYGFDKLKERAAQYSAERVEEISWVPAETLRAAARLFAENTPGVLEWGCAIEHNPNCFDSVRAIGILPGLTGSFDVPGGMITGMDFLPDCDALVGNVKPEIAKLRLGYDQFPMLAGKASGFPSAHIPTVFNAILTGEPYTLHALMMLGNNGLLGFADSSKTRRIYDKVDFLCCMDLFMTPTAELCDLVLPAATWMEIETAYGVPFNASHVAMVQKKLTRIGECKADEEFFAELCQRMGWDYGAASQRELMDIGLKEMWERHPQFEGVDYDKLCELNYIQIPIEYRHYEKDGRVNTPTGKVEFYSTVMEENGYDPLPQYRENPETPVSQPEMAKEYPLILITGGRSHGYFLTEGRQVPRLRKMSPYPRVELHPDTAAELGIKDGDWVWIENSRGRITQKALVTDGIDRRVVNCQHGWWYPEQGTPDHGWQESNVNMLTSWQPPYDPAMGTYQ
ncbi:MAG: molybdopterin-dependent oxidoreductase, partial [Oscillospiraceae bacterium]|nr:molybdopterin-dependent oxidoreductase [Oscillospiraceae bacterium]